jgi:uncharacterized Fe-S cluster-containing radical SAM superfamily protein
MNHKYNLFDATWYHVLTDKCNWKCSYCDFPKKKNPKIISIDFLNEYIEMIKRLPKKRKFKNIEFEIEGGEIGLVSKEILDIWFNSNLSNTYQVITNGKFFEKGYFDLYRDKIHYVIYHCISEFESAEQEFPIYDTQITDYTVVITKQNYKEFPNLLKKYPQLIWTPHFIQPRIEEIDEFLTPEDFNWIYEHTKKFPNLSEHIKMRLEKLRINTFYHKSLQWKRVICASYYRQPLIDLVNKRIYRCCISASGDFVELNFENLKNLSNNKKLFPKIENMCKKCYNHQVVEIHEKFINF